MSLRFFIGIKMVLHDFVHMKFQNLETGTI